MGKSLKAMTPSIPPHKFQSFIPDTEPPQPDPGAVVLICGAKALAAAQKAGIAPKNRGLENLRGKLLPHGGATYMVTYDPGIASSQPEKKEQIDWDLRLAKRFMETGSLRPKVGKYRWVASFQDVIDTINLRYEMHGAAVDLTLDLETMGLFPWYPDKHIVSISFTHTEGLADLVYCGPKFDSPAPDEGADLWSQINWLLTTERVKLRGANLKYDLVWIREKWGIECTNFKFDSMLVGSILDENRCVAPETMILTSDLRWVRADSLEEGDKLVGFDEEPPAPKEHRRMRRASVLSTEIISKPRLRLNLSNGSSVTVSDNHQFLCRKFPSTHVRVWRKAKNIKPGCVILHATPAPSKINGVASDFDRGRLSGFLDGEGSAYKVNGHGSWQLSWGQKPHDAHADMKRIASEVGFGWREHDDSINVCKTVAARGAYGGLHALTATRPLRLIAKEPWVDGPLPKPAAEDFVSVVSVEDVGVGPVVALETDTHTFIAEGLLSHNSNSLNNHAKLMTDMGGYDDGFNDKYDKGHFEDIDPVACTLGDEQSDFLTYAGGDTDACHQVSDQLREELRGAPGLLNFYQTVLHPAARAFEKIEATGVWVDVPKYQALSEELGILIKDKQKEALETLPNKLRLKHRDKIEKQLADGKNPLTPAILKDFFFGASGLALKPKMVTEKTQEPSTAKSHLKMFGDVPEAAQMVGILTDLDSASKTKSTFVDGFLNSLRPDGLLHPTYFLGHADFDESDDDEESGTVTGRLSAKNPAIQTLPKKTKWAKRLRECYIAPPGKSILQLDYSQGELRVVACLAPEPKMIAAYEKGLDLHAVTGAQIANIELELFLSYAESEDKKLVAIYKDARDRAKPANFGLLYGMSAEGFMNYAWASYGRKFTLAEAEAIRTAFFTLYPGLLKYHERMKNLVHMHEQVVSPLGRIRHLPTIRAWDKAVKAGAERQAINSPVQACLTDMMIWAIALIYDAYRNDEFMIFAVIHDAMYAYVDTDKIVERTIQAKDVMQNLPFNKFGWKPQLQFPADAEAGLTLASLEKVKLAA